MILPICGRFFDFRLSFAKIFSIQAENRFFDDISTKNLIFLSLMAPMVLRLTEGREKGELSPNCSLLVTDIGVGHGLSLTMLVRISKSDIYLVCLRYRR